VNASSPPAEAPMPTIGKAPSVGGGSIGEIGCRGFVLAVSGARALRGGFWPGVSGAARAFRGREARFLAG